MKFYLYMYGFCYEKNNILHIVPSNYFLSFVSDTKFNKIIPKQPLPPYVEILGKFKDVAIQYGAKWKWILLDETNADDIRVAASIFKHFYNVTYI